MSAALLLAISGIALLDSLNPSLFVAQFYLLTTLRPVPRILSYIGGVLAVNFIGGLVFLAGAQALIVNFIAGLRPSWLYGGGLALGIALLVFGLWLPLAPPANEEARQPHSLHPFHTFLLGAAVMVNELTTALPYFVAIERIASSGVEMGTAVALLVLYNLVFALPLFGFLGLFMSYGSRFAAQTERISAAIARWTPWVIKVGSLALGGFLALDAAAFFVHGDALFT
jgi:cytochrome c biogenesis protein CcdA